MAATALLERPAETRSTTTLPRTTSARPQPTDDLDALVESIVEGFPVLTGDEKRELGLLLATAA